jgi:hypothetical protein
MKIPHLSSNISKSLLEAMQSFRKNEPWELMEDDDIFGVQDPVSGEIGWCCILGSNAQVFALCMYRGSEGLNLYRKIQNDEFDVEQDDVFAIQNYLMAEFCGRAELEKEDLALVKGQGFKLDKTQDLPAYPRFRSHLPGEAPWHMTEEEAQWLVLALECSVDFAECLEEDEGLLQPEKPGHLLVYVPREVGGDKTSWVKRWVMPEPYNDPAPQLIPADELRIRKLKETPKTPDSAWEADSFYLTGGMILDRDRPYFARAAMIAHHESGFILSIEVLPYGADHYLGVRQGIFQAIEKHRHIPSEIWVRDENLWEALKPTTDALGITLRMKRNLSAILEAKTAIAEDSRSGFATSQGKNSQRR